MTAEDYRHRRNGSIEFVCLAILNGRSCRCAVESMPTCGCSADSVSRPSTLCLLCLDDMYAVRDGSAIPSLTTEETETGLELDRKVLLAAEEFVSASKSKDTSK